MQAAIDSINQLQKIESSREFSLGDLIQELKNVNQDLIVEIDNGTFPKISSLSYAEGDEQKKYEYIGYSFIYSKKTKSVFESWRGSYCELSMQFSDKNQNITTEKLLEMAEFINGKYLNGYKGGDFLMDEETPIHMANYGESGNIKLIGLEVKDNKLILKTR